MLPSKKCPGCGMDLPEALYASHVEMCTEDDVQEVVHEMAGESLDDLFNMIPSGEDDNDDMFGDVLDRDDEGGGGLAEPPSIDDEFQKLVGMLDMEQFGEGMPEVSVAVLNDAELSSRYNEVREELMKRGEMINPTTQIGRDLHSQRGAYIIELRRRGLMT
jgi:hypothetical protein